MFLAPCIDAQTWAIMQCQHAAQPLQINPVTTLYQCDPFFDVRLGEHPRVHAVCRDFAAKTLTSRSAARSNSASCSTCARRKSKRPLLFVEALQLAERGAERDFVCRYGYHCHLPSGDCTSRSLEVEIRRRLADLPVTFPDDGRNIEENIRRFNSGRIAVLTSSAEGGRQ